MVSGLATQATSARQHITQAEEMYTALRERGVDAELVRYPREGHGFHEPKHVVDARVRTLNWMDRYLGGKLRGEINSRIGCTSRNRKGARGPVTPRHDLEEHQPANERLSCSCLSV